MNTEALAWLAGLVDGDGSLFLRCVRPATGRAFYSPRAQIGAVCLPTLQRVHTLWGEGRIAPDSPSGERRCYSFYLLGRRACAFCAALAPYLYTKSVQAQYLLNYSSVPRDERERYAGELSSLNRRQSSLPAVQPSMDNFLPWLGGFFDAEGSVIIARSERRHSLRVSLSTTHQPTAAHLGRALSVGRIQPRPARVFGRLPYWEWSASSLQASQLIQDLLPFLHTKRDEALLALEFQQYLSTTGRPGRRVTPSDRERRDDYYRRLQRLKREELCDV